MTVSLVALEKPAVATAPILGTAGYIDSVTGSTFIMKLVDYDIDARVPREETSGDGDEGPTFDYVPWVYVDAILSGLMVASEPVGISNMDGQTLTTDFTIKLGSVQTFTLPGAVIHRIRIRATRRGLFNRVLMFITGTGSVSSTVWETA